MIAIATGIDALDQKTKQEFEQNGIAETMIVNYREFLLKSKFDTVIISKKLIGNIELEYLVLELKERDIRIIFLTNKDSEEEIRLCFKYGITDIITDPIDAELICNVYQKPKKFSDVKRLFLLINSNNAQEAKTIDMEKVKDLKNQQKKDLPRNDEDVEVPTKKEVIKPIIEETKKEIVEEPKKEIFREPVRPEPREVKPLTEEDFPKYQKKEVIKETIQETVYKLPNDYKKVIAIISPEPTGKTTLAVNMAWNFSLQHIRTTLIDTDYIKKDIYFHFDKNFTGCMSRLSDSEDMAALGIDINNNLKIYTENKDCPVEFGQYDLMKLIVSAKNNSQVVIVDVASELDEDTVKNILEVADNVIIVVDQKVTTLNRVPEELAKYRTQLHNVSIVVNRYYPLKHLEKEQIKDKFFECVALPNGREYDYTIDKIFTMSDDAKSVLQGLANRVPAMDLKNNFIVDDIKKICASYYVATEKQEKKKHGWW